MRKQNRKNREKEGTEKTKPGNGDNEIGRRA